MHRLADMLAALGYNEWASCGLVTFLLLTANEQVGTRASSV